MLFTPVSDWRAQFNLLGKWRCSCSAILCKLSRSNVRRHFSSLNIFRKLSCHYRTGLPRWADWPNEVRRHFWRRKWSWSTPPWAKCFDLGYNQLLGYNHFFSKSAISCVFPPLLRKPRVDNLLFPSGEYIHNLPRSWAVAKIKTLRGGVTFGCFGEVQPTPPRGA